MHSDIWAVTLGSDADFYVTTASGTEDTALTLAATRPNRHVSYKVTVTSAGDDSGISFTIVGTGVDGNELTEVLTGVNGGTATSSAYFISVTSITPTGGNTAGNVTAGYGGDAYVPATRIKGLYYVASGSAGSIVVTKAGNSEVILDVATPASATATQDLLFPSSGIRTADTDTDYSTVAVTNVTSVTLMCA